MENVIYKEDAIGCFGKMLERSNGKDSTTGHWEIAGLIQEKPFPVYPNGFNQEIIDTFLKLTGCKGILGNKTASGTEIIKELGQEHVLSGYPIIYTSADSVFQIAVHEGVIPIDRLYEICRIARDEIFIGKDAVARVIARPFIGEAGSFTRTTNRRDFSLKPPANTMIDYLQKSGINTIGVGKIDDLFAGQGLNVKIHTKSNKEGINETIKLIMDNEEGFIFVNLVDFDMLYGHRNDAVGFANALEYFDTRLTEILNSLNENDLLMLTADHGNDPSDVSTDHTREYVPILTYCRAGKQNVNIGLRNGFSDVSGTLLDFHGISSDLSGKSFLNLIL
jgi:phosphopentomutase